LVHPLLQSTTPVQGVQARTLFHQMRGTGAFLQNEFEEALQHYQQIVEDWRAHPHMIAQDPRRFLRALTNYMSGLQKANQFSAIPPLLEEIRRIKKVHGIPDSHRDTQLFHFEVLYYANSGQFVLARQAADRLGGFIQAFEAELSPGWKLPSAFNLGVVYFVCEAFRDALTWINYLIHFPATPQRKPLQHAARVLQLVLHYELGNLDLLEYLVRNSRAYLKRKKALDRFEATILTAINQLMEAADTGGKQIIFQELTGVLGAGFGEALPGVEEVHLWALARSRGEQVVTVAEKMIAP